MASTHTITYSGGEPITVPCTNDLGARCPFHALDGQPVGSGENVHTLPDPAVLARCAMRDGSCGHRSISDCSEYPVNPAGVTARQGAL